jgi:hypothetical protein
MRSVECGVWNAECGMRNVECGVVRDCGAAFYDIHLLRVRGVFEGGVAKVVDHSVVQRSSQLNDVASIEIGRRRISICGVGVSGCGMRNAECGMRSVECGVWNAECGMRSVECGVWNAECGVWSVECGVWSVECGVRTTGSGPRSGPRLWRIVAAAVLMIASGI